MHTKRSTLLALGLPALVALVYLGVCVKPALYSHSRYSRHILTAEDSSKLWDECNSLFHDGKYEAALPSALKLNESYPGNHLYIERAAEIYDKLGRYQEEAEFWEKYFDRAPNPLSACPQIGQAYWKQKGKEKEAIGAFERCLGRDPEDSDSIFYLAHALEQAGDMNRAAELYQRGLKFSPDYPDLRIGLARVWLRQEKLAEAKSAIVNVIRKSPNNVDALLVAGLVYSREGELDAAKQYLEKGVKLSDGYLDFHAALARIAEEQKNPAEAVRHYDRILQEHPDDQLIRVKRDALVNKQ